MGQTPSHFHRAHTLPKDGTVNNPLSPSAPPCCCLLTRGSGSQVLAHWQDNCRICFSDQREICAGTDPGEKLSRDRSAVCQRGLHGQPDIRRLLQAWLFPSEPKIVAEKGGKLNKGDRVAQPSLLQRGLLQHTTHHLLHLQAGSLAKGGTKSGRYTPGWFSKDPG